MREAVSLIAFEFRLMLRNPIFVSILLIPTLLLPLLFGLFGGFFGEEVYWIQTFHGQILFTIMALPTLFSFIWNEESKRFLPDVILIKLSKPDLYVLYKSLAFFMVIFMTLFTVDLFRIAVQAFVAGGTHFDTWLRFMMMAFATLAYSVQIVVCFSFLFGRVLYINIVILIYLLASMEMNVPLLSLWFNPDWIQSYFWDQSFLTVRMFLVAIAGLLMAFNVFLFRRGMGE